MAKRKAAPAATKRAKTRRTGVATRRAKGARTKAAPKRRATASRTTTRKAVRPAEKAAATARKASRPAQKKAATRKAVARKAAVRKGTIRKVTVRKAAVLKATVRNLTVRKAITRKTAAQQKAVVRKVAVRKAGPRKAAARKPTPRPAAKVAKPAPKAVKVAPPLARGKPALDRVRKTVHDDDTPVTGAPSSLDFDHRATSARSGRRHMAQHDREQAQTDPGITAGDVDADWESAETVGDEAPGGDNQTPDQDAVEENGEALGLVYEEAEELDGEGKISARDTDRWELDPESSDDFDERD